MRLTVNSEIQSPQFTAFPDSDLTRFLREQPGLTHAIIADLAEVRNPIFLWDAAGGQQVDATLTRSPLIVDGGATWNNRKIFDATGVGTQNTQLRGWKATPSFSAVWIGNRPAPTYMLRSANDALNLSVDMGAGTSVRFRTDLVAGSQTSMTGQPAPVDKTFVMASFDGDTMQGSLYLNDFLAPGAVSVHAANTTASGDLWISNSGASNGANKYAAVLLFNVALSRSVYARTRKGIRDFFATYYGAP